MAAPLPKRHMHCLDGTDSHLHRHIGRQPSLGVNSSIAGYPRINLQYAQTHAIQYRRAKHLYAPNNGESTPPRPEQLPSKIGRCEPSGMKRTSSRLFFFLFWIYSNYIRPVPVPCSRRQHASSTHPLTSLHIHRLHLTSDPPPQFDSHCPSLSTGYNYLLGWNWIQLLRRMDSQLPEQTARVHTDVQGLNKLPVICDATISRPVFLLCNVVCTWHARPLIERGADVALDGKSPDRQTVDRGT